MIVRIWLIFGTLLVAVAWILMVPLSPEPYQASAASPIAQYRAAGLLPAAGKYVQSTAIGHEVFEIPETDARHAAEEATMGGGEMPGMKMPGMKMPGMKKDGMKKDGEMPGMPGMKKPDEGAAMPGMPGMKKPGESAAMPGMPGMKKPDESAAMPGMKKPDESAEMPGMKKPDESAAMPGMKKEGEHAAMPGMPGMKKEGEHDGDDEGEGAGGHGGGGMAVGMTVLAQGNAAEVAAAIAGTRITRTVEIRMAEWGFEPRSIMVKPGEVIHLKIRNAGNLPHEFMFMPMAGMRAVNYRLERADWNLTEHEAISEQAVILPGDGFEQVVRIEKPGMWMYMCMFPYHMQFGMMGAMMTEGMAGMMGGMGGMGGMNMGGGKM